MCAGFCEMHHQCASSYGCYRLLLYEYLRGWDLHREQPCHFVAFRGTAFASRTTPNQLFDPIENSCSSLIGRCAHRPPACSDVTASIVYEYVWNFPSEQQDSHGIFIKDWRLIQDFDEENIFGECWGQHYLLRANFVINFGPCSNRKFKNVHTKDTSRQTEHAGDLSTHLPTRAAMFLEDPTSDSESFVRQACFLKTE